MYELCLNSPSHREYAQSIKPRWECGEIDAKWNLGIARPRLPYVLYRSQLTDVVGMGRTTRSSGRVRVRKRERAKEEERGGARSG